MTVCERAKAVGKDAKHIYDICITCANRENQETGKPCNRCVHNPEHEIGTTGLVDEYVSLADLYEEIKSKDSEIDMHMQVLKLITDLIQNSNDQLAAQNLLTHSMRVSRLCTDVSVTKLMNVTGLAHDLLEDTDCTYEQLAEINQELADNVLVLTRKEDESYADYIKRVKAGNDVVRKVKIIDIMDHLVNYETLKESLKERYLDALKTLLE
jgi:(p)ppGpp synthase/HD superfamily hydrolase